MALVPRGTPCTHPPPFLQPDVTEFLKTFFKYLHQKALFNTYTYVYIYIYLFFFYGQPGSRIDGTDPRQWCRIHPQSTNPSGGQTPVRVPVCLSVLQVPVNQAMPHKLQLAGRSFPSAAIECRQFPVMPVRHQHRRSQRPRAATSSSLINPITTSHWQCNQWINCGLLQVNGRRKRSRVQTELLFVINYEKPGLEASWRGRLSCNQHHPPWESGEFAPPRAR